MKNRNKILIIMGLFLLSISVTPIEAHTEENKHKTHTETKNISILLNKNYYSNFGSKSFKFSDKSKQSISSPCTDETYIKHTANFRKNKQFNNLRQVWVRKGSGIDPKEEKVYRFKGEAQNCGGKYYLVEFSKVDKTKIQENQKVTIENDTKMTENKSEITTQNNMTEENISTENETQNKTQNEGAETQQPGFGLILGLIAIITVGIFTLRKK